MIPAGDWLVFSPRTAIVLRPAESWTSSTAAVFQESVTRGDELIWVPLTQTSAVSSPVSTRVALPAAGTSMVRRKYRVDGGTPAAGSPSGYQIQLAPARSGATAACPMNSPVHSDAGLSRPVSKP